MIKLFYTGSGRFNIAQTLASKSLGGYISNTTVPNGVSGSLFSPLSVDEFFSKKKKNQYVGLGLYLFFFDNEEAYERINLKFNLTYSEENVPEAEFFKDLFKYRVGLGPISGDSTNGYYIEKITAGAKPYYMLQDFKDLNFDEEVIFEDIELNECGVGVWLNRTFDSTLFKERFGLESDYWELHDKLPNIDFILDLGTTFEGRGQISPVPIADFSTSVTDNQLILINRSKNFDTISWEYDNINIQNIYDNGNMITLVCSAPGTYVIKLIARKAGFPDSICSKTVTILS